MFETFPNETQKAIYIAALITAGIGLSVLLFIHFSGIKPWENLPGCTFYHNTGYYCPGCGGTRAVLALLHGHPFISFCYHPFVVYAAIMMFLFLSTCTAVYLFHCPSSFMLWLRPIYFYLAILLIFGNWGVKNVLIYLGYLS